MSRELARPLLPLLALGLWMAFRSPAAPPEARHQASLSTAIVKTLARQGWIGEAREVKWVDRPFAGPTSVWAGPRAVLRAHRIDEPADVLLLRTRVSPEGRFLAIARIDNLSDTAAVDEGQVQVSGNKVAWTVSVGDEITAIHTADLNGASLPQSADLGWVARLQIHLTWLQETGQFSGIEKREYRIDPPAKQVRLSYSGDDVVGQIDDLPFQLTPTEIRPNSGRIAQNPLFYGHPGNLVTWVADRVRALPWIGNDRMQLAKTLAFDAIDRFERLRGRMTRDNGLSSLNDEVGHVLDSASDDPTDPESGWPPPPMTPVLKEPIPHEGHWVELNKDPFVATQVGIPSPFLFSFIRTDRERTYTKVFVVLWDPRHVELHTMSGTREPKTATGETG